MGTYKPKDTRYHLQIELPQYKKNERGILIPDTCIIPYSQLHNVQYLYVEETEDPRKTVPLIKIITYEGYNRDGSNAQDRRFWDEHE